jgi:hypothetical protein
MTPDDVVTVRWLDGLDLAPNMQPVGQVDYLLDWAEQGEPRDVRYRIGDHEVEWFRCLDAPVFIDPYEFSEDGPGPQDRQERVLYNVAGRRFELRRRDATYLALMGVVEFL